MREEGIVIKIEGAAAIVEISPKKACTKCCSCGASKPRQIVITGETLLNFLEKELDMIRCPKIDLGEMGTLRVIEGWENETKRTKRKN